MNPARITGPCAIKLKELITLLLTVIIIHGCNSPERENNGTPMLAEDVKNYCRTDIAFTHIEDVVTKEQSDQMSTLLFAETLKYFFLAFSGSDVNPENYVFNTEAHPYRIANFDRQLVSERLGIK
jgi:hypothetical protein